MSANSPTRNSSPSLRQLALAELAKRELERRAATPPPVSALGFEEFVDEYLQEHMPTGLAPFHREIADMLAQGDRVAIAAPRSHAKSTIVTLCYTLWRAAYRQAHFILVISDTRDQSEGQVGNVMKELIENERLTRDFPHLRLPELAEYKTKKVKRQASDFITIGGIRFSGRSAGSALRGMKEGNRRPDLVVVDDLENDKAVSTPRQRQKLKDWFNKNITALFGSKGQLAVVGTILHKESLLNWLLSDDGPKAYLKRRFSALNDGIALWPEARSLDWLTARLNEIGSRAFATEYLNDPAQDDAVLFKEEWIRRAQMPTLTRTVIALDPSTSADGQRDACGISIAGRTDQKRFAVLGDETLNGSPSTWARRALDLYAQWQANEIVAEANQGGAMVESTLKAELRPGERLPPIRLVHASKGKAIRAEPVAVAYERGEVDHIGTFAALELEMTHWVPGMPSPNRLDALVWAMTRLTEEPKKFRFGSA